MNDFRFAYRQLLKHPGFTAVAVLTLALGLGLVTTQFSLIDGILLRGLPIADSQRLVHVSRKPPQTRDQNAWESLPFRDYHAFREQQTVLESLGALSQIGANLTRNGRVPSRQAGAKVSANLLDVLGVRPQLGRWFEAGEDAPGQALLIVLSHGLWQDEFGGDPGALGRTLKINGELGTIVGVMPPGFSFPAQQRVWTNLRAAPNDPGERLVDRVEMLGKLRPGVSLRQAAAEFDTIAARLAQAYPDTNRGYEQMNLTKFAHAYAGSGTAPVLYLMLAMTVFVLALACVNVANMLLGRAATRTRELAVRAAVGAGRWRLIRHALVEALLLAVLGAIGGLLLARLGVDQLQHQIVERMNVPHWYDFRLDHRVIGVAVFATLATGLLAGIVPAMRAASVDLNTALKDESRGASSMSQSRLSRWLVTAQIGFSSSLLVAAAVLGWTVYLTQQANLRYDPERILTGRIELHDATHSTPAARARFYHQLLARLRVEPGVETVAVSSRDLIFFGVRTRVEIEGVPYAHENEQPSVYLEVVSEDYFRLLGVGPVSGRLLGSQDHGEAPRAAVVNASFARKFWPDRDPLGQRFRGQQTDGQWVMVVGVVRDLQMQSVFELSERDAAGFYLAQDQTGWGWLNLLVRTRGHPTELTEPVRRAVAELDPDQPVHSIGTLADHTAREIRGFAIVGTMAGLFAAITLFLGAVGVYGVTSFAVSRRTREFGLRMALGATTGNVLKLVLRQGARQIGLGLGAGWVGAFLITRPMRDLFADNLVNSLVIYALVTLIIAAVGLLALWLPARRAARVDPMVALRSE